MADLDFLIALARAGGAEAMRFFGRAPKSWEKADGAGPVTEADLAVDALIRARTAGAQPGWGWLSEETADDGARLAARRVLILDPIDGTRAFAAGEKGWCVALALIEEARPVAAAAFFPALEHLYAARAGGGATLNGAPLAPSTRMELEGGTLLAGRGVLEARRWPGGAPKMRRLHRPSLVHRFCLTAQGEADAAIALRGIWEWDFAAGALIAAEAGCRVSQLDGSDPVFNRPTPRLDGLVVAPPALHRQIMARR